MYSFIRGQVCQKQAELIVIENQGIGYEVMVHPDTSAQLPAVGQEATIHTHLHVREDIFQLFGFANAEQKALFRLLLTVSGVGPKVALSISGSIQADRFALAVLGDDLRCLTSVKGVGKKVAQMIIIKLKDKLKQQTADVIKLKPQTSAQVEQDLPNNLYAEAESALLVLGYSYQEANEALSNAVSLLESKGQDITLDNLITTALRSLAKI